MAVTNKATLLRIKGMLLSGGTCPWGKEYSFGSGPRYEANKEHLCRSCSKVMGNTTWPDGQVRCPCGYWCTKGRHAEAIARQKIHEAGL